MASIQVKFCEDGGKQYTLEFLGRIFEQHWKERGCVTYQTEPAIYKQIDKAIAESVQVLLGDDDYCELLAYIETIETASDFEELQETVAALNEYEKTIAKEAGKS